MFEHGGLIATRLIGQLGAQMLLGVVERVLDQGGVGTAQRGAKLFEIFDDRAWRGDSSHPSLQNVIDGIAGGVPRCYPFAQPRALVW
jgi:hypothetical protein